jgi:hypothetical protein
MDQELYKKTFVFDRETQEALLTVKRKLERDEQSRRSEASVVRTLLLRAVKEAAAGAQE